MHGHASQRFACCLSARASAVTRVLLISGQALQLGMKVVVDTSADLGVESLCTGMPHRGAPAVCWAPWI